MNTRDKKRLEKKKRRKKIKYVLARGFLYATIAVAFAMGCFFFLIYRDMRGKIRKNLQVEVGTKVVLKNFFVDEEDDCSGYGYGPKSDAFDYNMPGVYHVELKKGMLSFPCELSVVDTTPPVIDGVSDIVVFLGEGISYKKGVTVSDNYDAAPELKVDSSKVRLSTEGTYEVVYYATDEAGNMASVACNVIVESREYPKEMVDEKAKEILATIISGDMTQEQKLTSIYQWIQAHITYVSYWEKNGWRKAAYEGLTGGQGDCYVYASVAKELLTVAGIENMDIQKLPDGQMHYWNLVNIGDGWFHYDTCPRADHTTFCYVTDEELMTYSKAHGDSHLYNKEDYPEIR